MKRTDTKTRAFLCLIIGLLFLLMPAEGFPASTYDDIVVSVESPAHQTRHGYAEYRFSVTNTSAHMPHRVTIFIPFKETPVSADRISRITRSIVVEPSSSALVSILHPPVTIYSYNVAGIAIDGNVQSEPLKMSLLHGQNWGRPESLSVLISRGVRADGFEHRTRGVPFMKAESSVEAWSGNWLAYSRYDGIVLTASEMQSLPASVDSALLQYVQCGGSLLVLGTWDKPAQWRSKEHLMDSLRLNYLHYGVCMNNENPDMAAWTDGTWNRIIEEGWGSSSSASQRRSLSLNSANKELPVAPETTIPARGILAVLVVFAVAIGPANFLILARKNKRIWVLWTTPVISLTACAAIVLYATLAEGWRGHISMRSFTILDESSHTATSLGLNGYYYPLTPRGGLHFEYATEATPVGLSERYRDGGGTSRTIDCTNDQHFSSGWVVARVPAYFLLRKSQMRRERVEITRTENNELAALNGLGADIQLLWFADAKGKVYKAERVAAGTKQVLVPTTDFISSGGSDKKWRDMYKSTLWTREINRLKREPKKYLFPNTYIAVLNDSAFVEQALATSRMKDVESVVVGLMKDSADANSGV